MSIIEQQINLYQKIIVQDLTSLLTHSQQISFHKEQWARAYHWLLGQGTHTALLSICYKFDPSQLQQMCCLPVQPLKGLTSWRVGLGPHCLLSCPSTLEICSICHRTLMKMRFMLLPVGKNLRFLYSVPSFRRHIPATILGLVGESTAVPPSLQSHKSQILQRQVRFTQNLSSSSGEALSTILQFWPGNIKLQ